MLATTKAAFAAYSKDHIRPAYETVAALKGVGPATASLIMSCYDPANAAFFSDELFRWLLYEDGEGKGWDRKIAYNWKSLTELQARVDGLPQRSQGAEQKIELLQMEKAAKVLAIAGAGGSRKRPTDEIETVGKRTRRK